MMADEALYKAYLDGDDAGLALLMERYGNRLTFYINGYLHDIHDSEDLMIEAFAYLISKNHALGKVVSRHICIKSLEIFPYDLLKKGI